MQKAKLNEVPFIGEFLTGKSEKTGADILDAKGKPLEPKVTKDQMDLALQIQKEQSADGKSPFILDVLADNAEKIGAVKDGKAYQNNDVWDWKKESLPFQASKRAEAAKEDLQNLDKIDAKDLKTQDWMYNARQDKPSPDNSAIEVANISNLTVRLAKEGLEGGTEVSDTVKKGVGLASRLVEALNGKDENILLGQKPEDLLQSVRDGLNDAAKSAGKSDKIEKFNDNYFKNVSDGLQVEQKKQQSVAKESADGLTDAEKQTRSKVIKRMYSKVEKGELGSESFEKLVKKLTTNEGKEDYVKNVKELHGSFVKKEQEKKEQKGSQAPSR
jgi:hypothetical protein